MDFVPAKNPGSHARYERPSCNREGDDRRCKRASNQSVQPCGHVDDPAVSHDQLDDLRSPLS
jgi:hypothetical protein